MPLHLSDSELTAVADTLRTLLSPLSYDSTDEWRRAVNRSVCEATRSQRAMFFLAAPGVEPIFSEDHDRATLRSYTAHYAAIDEGARRREASALEVWTRRRLFPRDLEQLHGSEFYNEYCKSVGLLDSMGMVDRDQPGSPGVYLQQDRFGLAAFGERGVKVLRLLLPALKAGLSVHARMAGVRNDLARVIDGLDKAIVAFDACGRVLHCTPAFEALLSPVDHRAGVWAHLAALRERVAALTSDSAADKVASAATESRIDVGGQCYLARASLIEPGIFAPQRAVLLLLQPVRETLPSQSVAMTRFGLTRREAEVAGLLADGLSNKQVAHRLGVSPNTARHHTERVLQKLDARSRAAVRTILVSE